MKKTTNILLSFSLILTLFLVAIPLPTLASDDSFKKLEATAGFLIDTQYDTVLYEKNIKAKRYPASLTKIMTALLVLEAIERGDIHETTVFTASEAALEDISEGSSTSNIQAGEQMSVENLLYCLLVPSANEASNILAEGVSGSIPDFVDRMNTRAQELGLEGTHFANPHGLHDDDHYSTAYDIYLMTKEALKHPLFSKIVSTPSYTIPATNMSEERTLLNTNALLTREKFPGYVYEPTTGIKTGHTDEAGYCLVSSAQSGGRSLIAVVLGADNIFHDDGTIERKQFSESKRLLQWGFSNFKAQTLLDSNTVMEEIPVAYGKGVSYVVAQPASTITAVLPRSYDPDLLEAEVELASKKLAAPVRSGQKVGTVTVSYDGTSYGTSDLITVSDVERSNLVMVFSLLKAILTSWIFWLGLLVLFLLILFRYLRALRRKPRRGAPPPKNKAAKPTRNPKARR